MADWLETIANRVRQKRQVDLDQAALGSELFGSLQRLLLSGETFSLNDCDVTASEAGSLDIKGTSNSLSWAQPVSVQICLVASSANRRDCILLVELPDKALEPYLECFDEDVYDTVSEIADVQRCVFSSAELPYPGNWPAEYPAEKLGVGVNFLGKVTLDDYFAECLSDACGSQPFSEKAVGLIGDFQKEEGNPQRCLRLRKTPSGKLGSTEIGVIKIELRQIDLSIALDVEEGPEVHVSGSVTIGQAPPFDVSAAIDWFDESVTVSFQNLPSLSDLLDLIKDQGLDPLREWFKGHLNLQLSELWIKLYWPGAGAGSAAADGDDERVLAMGFSLTTDNPIPLFANDFKITPKLEMQISYPFSKTMRTLEGTVSGKCKLGEVELEGKLAIPGWSFSAELDSKLDSLVSPLGLGTIGLPEELKQRQVKFTVSGDVPAKFYSARLEITEPTKPNEPNATWSGTGVAQNWKLTRVAIEVDYDGSNEDNKFSYWLNATLEISRRQGDPYRFDVEGGYDEGWFLSGSTESEIDVSQLINDLLQGLSLPMPEKDLKLTNVALSANFTSGDFNLSGQTAGAWTLFDGLSLNVEHFSFDKSSEGISARILVSLTISDVVVLRLSAEKAANVDAGWEFNGSTGQKIVIGDLIKVFDKDAKPPPALDTLTIENLEVSFHTASKDFTYKFAFTCEGKFKVNGTEVDCVVTITIERPTNAAKPKIEFGGEVTVGTLTFEGKFWQEDKIQALIATYHPKPPATSEDITITTLVGELPIGDAMPKLTIGLKDALFVYEKTAESAFLFGVDLNIGATIDTSKWGVIGSLLGKQEIGLDDLRVLVASADFNTDQVTALNKLLLLQGIKPPLPVPSSEAAAKSDREGATGSKAPIAISKGFNFSGNLKLGSLTPPPLMLPASGTGDTPRAKAPNQPAAEASTAKWIDIKKSLGPLYLGRVGFQYRDQKIGVLLDAAVDLAGLHVSLLGFQIRFPLKALEELTLPELDLDGLELGYDGGPLQITGSFLRVPNQERVQYDGMALIKAADFMIAGLGSYTTMAGAPSMFIYAVLHAELGGPPFFRVQGLAAGFGYNRKLTLPPIEEVQTFALVRAALDEKFITKDTRIGEVLDKLRDYISPSLGDYWLAAGIRFSSFEMIQAFALLSVSFGHEVEIGLLGLAKMSLPRGTPPGTELAYAELALRVVVKPEEGTVAVEGRLTDASYILSKDCRLTGGFAFFLWCTGEHAGDFVVTLGGYHPKFVRPAHYPIVPRLGIYWQVSKELLVTAEMYFALTPSCIMAGGKLAVVYQSGSIKAWFVAYADFLLNWQPFYYQADMGISIGVQANVDLGIVVISIRLELSVDLHLWGPPFSGEAQVNLSVISFTIPFGGVKKVPGPLNPDQFVEKFLPPPPKDKQPEIIAVRIGSGLIQQREKGKDTSKEIVSVVNAHALSLTAESLIPSTNFDGLAKEAKYKEPDKQRLPIEKFGIRPMGAGLTSTLEVRLKKGSEDLETPKNLRATFVENGVPDALWGRGPNGKVELPSTPERKIIPATQGVYFSFLPFEPEHPLAPIPLEKLTSEQLKTKTVVWQDLGHAPTILGSNTFWNTIWRNDQVKNRRKEILDILRAQSPFPLNEPHLEHINQLEKHYFQSDPEFCNLGEQLV